MSKFVFEYTGTNSNNVPLSRLEVKRFAAFLENNLGIDVAYKYDTTSWQVSSRFNIDTSTFLKANALGIRYLEKNNITESINWVYDAKKSRICSSNLRPLVRIKLNSIHNYKQEDYSLEVSKLKDQVRHLVDDHTIGSNLLICKGPNTVKASVDIHVSRSVSNFNEMQEHAIEILKDNSIVKQIERFDDYGKLNDGSAPFEGNIEGMAQ